MGRFVNRTDAHTIVGAFTATRLAASLVVFDHLTFCILRTGRDPLSKGLIVSTLAISLVAFAFVFGGALLGMHATLPEGHLREDAKDVIRLSDSSVRWQPLFWGC